VGPLPPLDPRWLPLAETLARIDVRFRGLSRNPVLDQSIAGFDP
jgi:hypothetical protein